MAVNTMNTKFIVSLPTLEIAVLKPKENAESMEVFTVINSINAIANPIYTIPKIRGMKIPPNTLPIICRIIIYKGIVRSIAIRIADMKYINILENRDAIVFLTSAIVNDVK